MQTSKYCNTNCKEFQGLQKGLQNMKVLQIVLQKYLSIVNSIAKYESITKGISKFCVAEFY